MLHGRGVCEPPADALAAPAMPPCSISTDNNCQEVALAHAESKYSKPWESHHTFSGGYARPNPTSLVKTHLNSPVSSDESYNVRL